MANLAGFDATTTEPVNSYDPVPAGEYVAMAIASERRENSKGTGSFLKFTFQIQDGPHAGRKLFTNFNIWHADLGTANRAKADLTGLCRAVGVTPTESEQLHHIPCVVKVIIKNDPGRDPQNEIRGYRAMPTSAAPAFQPPRQAAPAFVPPPVAAAAPQFVPPSATQARPW